MSAQARRNPNRCVPQGYFLTPGWLLVLGLACCSPVVFAVPLSSIRPLWWTGGVSALVLAVAGARIQTWAKLAVFGTSHWLAVSVVLATDAGVRFTAFWHPGVAIVVGCMYGGAMVIVCSLTWSVARLLRGWPVPFGKGQCSNCGYDLRGLIEPRCPECGTKFDPVTCKLARSAAGTAGDEGEL